MVVGRAHEMNRDYRAATDAYERFLSVEQPEREKLDALHQISMSALNSKDPERTERWMRAFMAAEKDAPGTRRRSEGVRTSYYWRTLLELGRFEELEEYGELLAKDAGSAAARSGGAQARFVAAVNLGRLEQAEEILQTLTSAPEAYPNLQGWAMQGRLALLVHRGEAEKGAHELDEWLTRVAADENPLPASAAVEANHRRWLTTISSYLGKPAPAVVVDKWVAADPSLGGRPLADWKGKVVVLDFWQSWCEPCRNAMPHLVALQKAHADLRVVGLCRVQDYGYDVLLKKAVRPIEPKDYPAHVEKFHSDMKLNYPLGIRDTGANNRAYQVQGIPTLVVIDRAGIVRYMSIGAGERGLLELAIEGVVGRAAR
jgi:thiol-disulfide isomerase/thioredoxin